MKKITSFFTLLCCLLAISSCRYDNYDEPQSLLTVESFMMVSPFAYVPEVLNSFFIRTDMPFITLFLCMLIRMELILPCFLMENINSYVWVMLLGNALQMIRFL